MSECKQATATSQYQLIFVLGRSYSTKDEYKLLADRELNASTLSTQRLNSFFANENYKSNSPSAWGQTSVSTATKNMGAQLQAFDKAFNKKGKSE
jgi:hypothetical protein